MAKTKIMVSGLSLNLLKKIWKESLWGLSNRCRKKCRPLWWMLVLDPGIKGSYRRDPDFSSAGCLGKARPINGRLVKEVLVDDKKVEAVPEFCYLGDMLSAGGGCELATVTHCKSA